MGTVLVLFFQGLKISYLKFQLLAFLTELLSITAVRRFDKLPHARVEKSQPAVQSRQTGTDIPAFRGNPSRGLKGHVGTGDARYLVSPDPEDNALGPVGKEDGNGRRAAVPVHGKDSGSGQAGSAWTDESLRGLKDDPAAGNLFRPGRRRKYRRAEGQKEKRGHKDFHHSSFL